MDGEIVDVEQTFENEVKPDNAVAPATVPASGSTTVWSTAFEQWRDVHLKEQLTTKWDEAFEHVVHYKEGTANEKHRLVTTVKEFAASYKQEPTNEKVETLLKFFKKYISGLFDRVEVSERCFIGMYQSISMAPDPAPLLFAAHVEISNLVRSVRELQSQVASKTHALLEQTKLHEAAVRDVLSAQTDPSSSMIEDSGKIDGEELDLVPRDASTTMHKIGRELREMKLQLEDLRGEKRSLIEIVRETEALAVLSREEANRLAEDRRQLHAQLLLSQTRYEEYVARTERDTSVLMDELHNAHEQLLLLQSVATTGSGAQLVQTLETEIEQLRRTLAECETKVRITAPSIEHAIDGAGQQPNPLTSISGVSSGAQDDLMRESVKQLTQRLQEEVSERSRQLDETTLLLMTERRTRRDCESERDSLLQRLRDANESIEALRGMLRVKEEAVKKFMNDSINVHDGMEKMAQQPLATSWKTTDDTLRDMIDTTTAATVQSSTGKELDDLSANRQADEEMKMLSDPILRRAVLQQRESWKAKAIAFQSRTSELEEEVEHLRREIAWKTGESQLNASSRVVTVPGDNEDAESTRSVFGDARYKAAVLASVASPLSNITTAPAADSSLAPMQQPSQHQQNDRRRRKMLQQTVKRATDSVAVVIANMIMHSATTRMMLVLYVLGLHVVIMWTTYAMAFRGSCTKGRSPQL